MYIDMHLYIDMYCTTLLAKYHTTLPSLFGPL
jgi:hypothetical protein